MSDEFVVFVVGGVTYPICKRDIVKHPDSFLSTAVKKEWHDGRTSIHVDRDSDLFRHIYVYLVGGCLSKEAISSTDGALLDSLRLEADFYGLPELAKECTVVKVIAPFNTYQDVRRVVENCGSSRIRIDCPREQTTPLLKALGTIFVPFCTSGRFSETPDNRGKISQFHAAMTKITATSSPYSPLRGRKAAPAPSTRVCALPFSQLDLTELRCVDGDMYSKISSLFQNRPIRLQPFKLITCPKGCGQSSDQYRDPVEGSEGRIGTVVVTLNSEFTGAELEITHAGKTETVPGSYSWVAMYSDCVYKINPVTSGTRRSLIYHIYPVEKAQDDQPVKKRTRVEYWAYSGGESAGSSEDEYTDDEDHEPLTFWNHSMYDPASILDVSRLRGGDVPAIHAALNKELARYDSLVICLQHMYPACQAVPDGIKGTDAVLYGLLQDHYDTRIVYCCIRRTVSTDGGESVSASVFTSFGKQEYSFEKPRTKVVVPARVDPELIIESLNYDGEEFVDVYMVTGLQVSRKE
jgi:hypothetical protein